MFGLLRIRSRPPVARRQRSSSLSTSEATMQSLRHACVRAALAVVFASGGWYGGAAAQDPRSALDPITSAVMQHPITTSSGVARDHFLRGKREFDLARFIDANAHFKEAVAADPDFAFGYLNVANTANSLAEFKSNLALAEQHAAGASEAERLQIQMVRKGFDQDLAAQLGWEGSTSTPGGAPRLSPWAAVPGTRSLSTRAAQLSCARLPRCNSRGAPVISMAPALTTGRPTCRSVWQSASWQAARPATSRSCQRGTLRFTTPAAIAAV